ncbi:MAG: methionyl-tRNA formyltransferase [Bacteroidales bacterium]|nr:methionyl-tRNA formyltransferase [Bacteroidales bacterium]
MRIVFFGTPEFAVASLERLIADGHDIAAVVTMPDKRGGRNHLVIESDVKKCALAHGLPLLQPEKLRDPEFIERLKSLEADLFVVIAFRMLPEMVWAMPPKGTFNLHASLLPRYRGAAPINWAIINGDTRTGVTTFFLSHEIDTGDIIAQREVDILPSDNVGSLYDRLMAVGADMTSETVKALENGDVRTIPQPEGEFVPAPKIFKETCRIDWNADAVAIHNKVRGLSPYPAAWSVMTLENGSELDAKIFETRPCDSSDVSTSEKNPAAGDVLIADGRLMVCTADGCLEILSIQPAGKKRMEAAAFLRGYHPVHFK